MANTSKIKIGDKYGKWIIIELEPYLLCRCECGYEKKIRRTDWLRKISKQCWNCYNKNRNRKNIAVGKKYNNWIIVSISDKQWQLSNGKKVESKWHVKCKCGYETFMRTSLLISGKTQGCRECSNKKRRKFIGEIPLSLIKRHKEGAKKRKIEWNISNEYLWKLFKKQNRLCALSGVQLQLSKRAMASAQDRKINTSSLDRIDSLKGYVKGNVQWLHKDVNKMKVNLDEKRFIELCNLVSKQTK